MRCYVVHRYGDDRQLALEEAAEPAPARGQVRVSVKAIGLNFADLMQRQGVYPKTPPTPMTPGMELSGIVDALGEGAPGDLLGKRVMAVPIFGGHAEKVCLGAEHVMEMPGSASFAEGAAFSVIFLTAHYALHDRGCARAGEKVVLTAAAGGVGTAVLQMARLAGLSVMGVVGSQAKQAMVKELGAAYVSSYERVAEDVKEMWGSADIVIDSVGGKLFRPLWKLLAPGGRYVLYGFSNASTTSGISYPRAAASLLSMGVLFPTQLATGNRTFTGFNLSAVPNQTDLLRANASKLLGMWSEGRIRPVIGRTFRFEEMAEAHRFIQSRASTGKVVVTLDT